MSNEGREKGSKLDRKDRIRAPVAEARDCQS